MAKQRGRSRFDHLSRPSGLGLIAAWLAIGAATPACAQAAGAPPASSSTAASPVAPGDAQLQAGKLPVPPPPPEAQLPAVDPVIPDDRFNKSIPSLDVADDPELNRPLESIDAFERELAARQSPAAKAEAGAPPANPSAPPTAAPSSAGASTPGAGQVGDAPVNDAELTKPLPPLDQFQVEPVQFAEKAEQQKSTEVAYTVEVNGLDKPDADANLDLRSMFDKLSALHGGHGKAANAAMVSARLIEDQVLMERVLASEGWFAARVRTRIERGDPGQPVTAVLDVTPGKRFDIGSIAIQSQPTIPPGLIEKNLALKVGEPIVADRVQGAEAQIALVLPQNGYPFAKVGQRDILLDRDTGLGDYTLPVTIGPRGRFGAVDTKGKLAFDARHVAVLARFKRGELYDSRKVDDLRQAMVATGLFSSVAVEPQQTGRKVPDQPPGDDTEYVDMMVTQQAGPPRSIAATAGYATGQGFQVEATWTHRNLFPPEGALIVHGIGGTQQQGGGVTFRRSNAGQRDRTFELDAEALHSTYDAYNAKTGRLAATLTRDSTPIWQKKFTYSIGVEFLATAESDYDFTLGARNQRTFYIGGISGQVGIDHSDSLLNPTKGFRVTAFVEPEGSVHDGFTPYVRARLDASAYWPVSKSLVLAGRIRVGTIQGADRNDIAPSRRFYAGGGGSVRGYGYQELGPQDPDGKPVGGRSLNEASGEVRYRFGNFGIVGFVDAGQSYESTIPQFSDLHLGAGIGGRFYTNFGPLRLDLATPLNPRPGDPKIAVYVSIGQAF